MEDTLRVNNKTYGNIDTCKVLILVLMEDTLRVAMFNENAQSYES